MHNHSPKSGRKHYRCRHRIFRTNKSALSSLITVAGILAVILFAISAILNTLVPQWAKEDESEHMEDVLQCYISMRVNVNKLIENNDFELATTQRIKLGASGNIPVGVIPSSGKLTLHPFDVNTEESVTNLQDMLSIYGKGGGFLEYKSNNFYFNDQTIIYEHGAVLLAQPYGAVIKVGPLFSASKYPLLNESRSFGYFDPGSKDNPDEVVFRFPGRYGSLTLTYEAYDLDRLGEVIIKLNGYTIALPPITLDKSWGNVNALEIDGNMINDFMFNTLEFNHTGISGSDPEWGVRNIALNGEVKDVQMTMISLMGAMEDVGGRDTHTVNMKLLGSELNSYWWPMENLSFNFTTKHPEAWSSYLNDMLNRSETNLDWFANRALTDYYIATNQISEDYFVVSLTIKEITHMDCTLANIRMKIT